MTLAYKAKVYNLTDAFIEASRLDSTKIVAFIPSGTTITLNGEEETSLLFTKLQVYEGKKKSMIRQVDTVSIIIPEDTDLILNDAAEISILASLLSRGTIANSIEPFTWHITIH